MRSNMAIVSVLLLCGVAGYDYALRGTSRQLSVAAETLQTPTTPAQSNPNQETNNRFVQQIAEKIAGHENEPAEKVFKNIKWLKDVPARRFLQIMNFGYSRALGVACTHCHVEEDFSSDDKRPKRAAREMAVMHRMINEQLQKMENVERKLEERFINCSTCHRGAISPIASGG